MKKLIALTPEKEKELQEKLEEYSNKSQNYWRTDYDDSEKVRVESYTFFKDIMLILLSQLGEVTDVKEDKKDHWAGSMLFKLDGKPYNAFIYFIYGKYVTISTIENASDIYEYNSGKCKRYILRKDMFLKSGLPKHRAYNIGDLVLINGKAKYIVAFRYKSGSIEYYINDKILPRDIIFRDRYKYDTISESKIKPLKGGL